jgi:DNA repair exonuclease SbcCD ATPase subunit
MKLYTLAEIAQELNLPESTLRYYRKALGDRIPAVGTGRQARFPEEAIEVFRKTAIKVRENGRTLQNALVELIDEGEVTTGENAITASLETIRETWREEARAREEQHTATLNALREESRQREEALMAHLAALQEQAQQREEQARRREAELTARLDALQEALERPWWDRWRRLLGRK